MLMLRATVCDSPPEFGGWQRQVKWSWPPIIRICCSVGGRETRARLKFFSH